MSCTGLKCLNTIFICYATQLPGGGALFLIKIFFNIMFLYLQLQEYNSLDSTKF